LRARARRSVVAAVRTHALRRLPPAALHGDEHRGDRHADQHRPQAERHPHALRETLHRDFYHGTHPAKDYTYDQTWQSHR